MNLSIKNVPDEIVESLRERATRNHRSLQGELMAIIEAAVARARPFDAHALLAEVRKLELRSPSEFAAMIREDRDSR